MNYHYIGAIICHINFAKYDGGNLNVDSNVTIYDLVSSTYLKELSLVVVGSPGQARLVLFICVTDLDTQHHAATMTTPTLISITSGFIRIKLDSIINCSRNK